MLATAVVVLVLVVGVDDVGWRGVGDDRVEVRGGEVVLAMVWSDALGDDQDIFRYTRSRIKRTVESSAGGGE